MFMTKYDCPITYCPPSKRRASSSIQRKTTKYRTPQQGALHIAKEKGLKITKE
jgi:hypothetical protein